MIYELIIDDDFRCLIPPLMPDERRQLEDNIRRDGCHEPLSVWNNTILDGHNRYDICVQFDIPFIFICISLKSREEAISWICANQLGRRNISEEARRYLIGKRYEMEKILGTHNASGINQHTKKEVRSKILAEPLRNGTICRTRERLAKEYRISHATVDKYGTYARAVDSLSKTVPELPKQILSGQVKISHSRIVGLTHLSQSRLRQIGEHFADNADNPITYSYTRKILPSNQYPKRHQQPSPSETVKDMPVYDPDAEILSLALTIPSWIRSIQRIQSGSDFNKISADALYRLENELTGLRANIHMLLSEIKGED